MTHLLDEIHMQALGCVIHMREPGTQVQVAHALTPLAEELELDDVGYLYDQNHLTLCTVPGQLVGAINNTRHKSFQFGVALRDTVSVLKSLDEDYRKLVVAVTDYAKESDLYYAQQAVTEGISILIYGVGKKWHSSLESLGKDMTFVKVADATELMEKLLIQ